MDVRLAVNNSVEDALHVAPAPSPRAVPSALQLAREYLEAHYTEAITLDRLAEVAGRSKYHLVRQFRRHVGMTPHAYVLALRVRRAQELLRAGSTVVDVAFALGFCDHSHFLRVFKRIAGTTPGAFARGVALPVRSVG